MPAQVIGAAPLPAYTQLSDGRWVITQLRDDGTVQTSYIGARSPAVVTLPYYDPRRVGMDT